MMKRVPGKPETGHRQSDSPYQPPIAGEVLPRPITRRAAIPADAVARLLPRYKTAEKAREFASFLLDFEASPYAASLEHPIFAWRLSSAFKGSENEPPAWKVLFSFSFKRGQPEKRREMQAITGEQLEAALKKDDAFAAISGQLSEKQAPSRPADAVHVKRTKKWADWADYCRFLAGMAAFMPASHFFVIDPLFGDRGTPGFSTGTVALLGAATFAFMAAISTARHLLSFSTEGARLAAREKKNSAGGNGAGTGTDA